LIKPCSPIAEILIPYEIVKFDTLEHYGHRNYSPEGGLKLQCIAIATFSNVFIVTASSRFGLTRD